MDSVRSAAMTLDADDEALVAAVLAWGEANLRDLPWRRTRDPWAILVSETMLQQTQVARVVDRLPRFLERFPTPEACASAPAGDVVDEWSGLGYNRRPLNLHRAAVAMVERHGGRVPERLDDLLALPGVGPYTARAVRAFAHEQAAAVVDTNIGRVLARWAGHGFTPKAAQVRADELAPVDRPCGVPRPRKRKRPRAAGAPRRAAGAPRRSARRAAGRPAFIYPSASRFDRSGI